MWAILARARFSELRPDLRAAAARLLTAREIAELQTGGVKKYTDAIMQKAIRKAPRQVRQALRAEARLRLLVTDANATFEEAERVAVLLGAPPRDKKERKIPSGRWSLHPRGFFIRYFPSGYDKTRIQIYRPAPFTMKRGPKGRIVAMAWTGGYRIEFTYNDDIEPLRIAGEKKLRGYAFRSIRFTRPHPRRRGRTQTAEIKNQGWTFVGRPSGKKRKKKRAYARPPAPSDMAFGFWTPPPGDGFYGEVAEHLERAQKVGEIAGEVDRLRGRFNGENPSADAINDLVDVGHIGDGLEVGLTGGFGGQVSWMWEHSNRLADGFRYVGCAIAGECALPDGSYMPASPGKGIPVPDFDFGEVAVPGNRHSQRLGISGRSN